MAVRLCLHTNHAIDRRAACWQTSGKWRRTVWDVARIEGLYPQTDSPGTAPAPEKARRWTVYGKPQDSPFGQRAFPWLRGAHRSRRYVELPRKPNVVDAQERADEHPVSLRWKTTQSERANQREPRNVASLEIPVLGVVGPEARPTVWIGRARRQNTTLDAANCTDLQLAVVAPDFLVHATRPTGNAWRDPDYSPMIIRTRVHPDVEAEPWRIKKISRHAAKLLGTSTNVKTRSPKSLKRLRRQRRFRSTKRALLLTQKTCALERYFQVIDTAGKPIAG